MILEVNGKSVCNEPQRGHTVRTFLEGVDLFNACTKRVAPN